MVFKVTTEEDRLTLALENMESGDSGTGEMNSSGQTIAQLITLYSIENKHVFDICGSIQRIGEKNIYFTLWRYFSVFIMSIGLLLTVYSFVSELIFLHKHGRAEEDTHLDIADILLNCSVGVQLVITAFSIQHCRNRMNTRVTPEIAVCMEESMGGTLKYFRVCSVFFVGGFLFLSIGVKIYDNGGIAIVGINALVYLSFQFASYSLSIWAILFIRLDASLLKAKLVSLLALAKNETLTPKDLQNANFLHSDLKQSRKLCEGIVIGAGFNVAFFVLLCFVFETMGDFKVWIIFFICMALCTMGREILQLWYILPIVADVNEIHTELCEILATTEEWKNETFGNISLWVLLQQRPLKYSVFNKNWNRDDIKTSLFSTGVVLLVSIVRFLLFSVVSSV